MDDMGFIITLVVGWFTFVFAVALGFIIFTFIILTIDKIIEWLKDPWK